LHQKKEKKALTLWTYIDKSFAFYRFCWPWPKFIRI